MYICIVVIYEYTTQSFVFTQFKCQTSIRPIDSTLSDATTQGESRPGSNGYEEALYILQSPKTGTLDWYRTFIGGGFYLSVEMQSVYFTAPADWAKTQF